MSRLWNFLSFLESRRRGRNEINPVTTYDRPSQTTAVVTSKEVKWHYVLPPIYFLRWGNARTLAGTVTALTKSEARSKVAKMYDLDRFPEGGLIEFARR